MKFATNREAGEIPHEREIGDRCEKLFKRDDCASFEVIGVLNEQGQLRVRITTHTQAESDGIIRFLEDRHFNDAINQEEINEDGDIEGKRNDSTLPNGYDSLYSPARTVKP